MCWNGPVSILTFAFVLIIFNMFRIRNLPNDMLLGYFILGYGSMQLFEFMMWHGQPCGWTNKIGSFLACILLFAHPLFVYFGLKHDKAYTHISPKTFRFLFAICLLVLLVGVSIMIATRNQYKYCSYPHPDNHHLVWDFPNRFYDILIIPICLAIAVTFVRPWSILAAIGIYYFGTAAYAEYIKKMGASVGSYWCWMVAIFAALLYIGNGMINAASV